ncbi:MULTISPECIES: hypothetical protein [Sorangium]|uniref:Uncharacterized protein n=1 Tax=Sorangium cellulosum TaxID=56 RepID=A0A4P2R2E9_SORCE|nr:MULTISPECIES: hypothetical protein [Sorangium]AUX37150.1 hypothetical protein SOCE836_093720 [Sorangium cellulosum]WCQ96440.1 hypothetical protein NQZ70_09227 [Sorangium sp. Soce836]
MSESRPHFFAWCNEPERVDALASALSALVIPGDLISVDMATDIWCKTSSMDDALAMIRAHFGGRNSAHVLSGVMLNDSERIMVFSAACYPEESERRHPFGPLRLEAGERKWDFYPYEIPVGGGPRSIEAEAAVACHLIQGDIEDLLLRFCAPDTSGRVPTGACTDKEDWLAPVVMCATYNANAAELARDLALSWVSLHDKESVSRVAGTSLEALCARVEAAPRGARVPMKGGSELTRSLSRETVLKALATPPATLLEALEAAAVPDDAWRAAEPQAHEIMELLRRLGEAAEGEGPPAFRAKITSPGHVRFLEEHAPFHVRRLPSGGVVLATHPYRTLWPLWSDALFVLGLMS